MRLPHTSRNLVIVRSGDKSLHEGWLAGPEARDWDLIVSYFGDDETRYRRDDVVRIDRKGPKWPALHHLAQALKPEIQVYDFVWLPDDDLATDKQTINRLFALCAQLQLELAQPALSPDSFYSHPITIENKSFIVRYTNFVEIMAPVFSREFFARCAETFGENLSGYGLDSLWPTWISDPRKIGIVDACVVKHTHPVGGPNYTALAAAGVTAREELTTVLEKYRLPALDTATVGGIDYTGRELLVSEGHGAALSGLIVRGYLQDDAKRAELVSHVLRPVLQQVAPTNQATAPPSRSCPVLDEIVRQRREEFRVAALERVAAQLCENGHHAAAANMLAAALVAGEVSSLWNDWASAECGCGHLLRAELGFRRALQLDPSERQAGINLAALLLSQGRSTEAVPLITAQTPSLNEKEKRALRDLVIQRDKRQSSQSRSPAGHVATDCSQILDAFSTVLALFQRAELPSFHESNNHASRSPAWTRHFVTAGCALLRQLPEEMQQEAISQLHSREVQNPRLALVAAHYHMLDGDIAAATRILRTLEDASVQEPALADMRRRCEQASARTPRSAAGRGHCAHWRDAVALLRREPLERLRDVAYLEREFLPLLGLNDELLGEFPSFLYPYCGGGLKSWQYPNQFAPYLRWLSEQRIESYLEIGSRHGGTFIATVEYLHRFHPFKYAACVDLVESAILREYAQYRAFEYRVESSTSETFRRFVSSRSWDLALIDGDHSWHGVNADFELVKSHARLIALHDICSSVCPGVEKMWTQIRSSADESRALEWCQQYPEVISNMGGRLLGIGVYRNELSGAPS